jgi:allantoin racemase
MNKKVLWINPVGWNIFDQPMAEYFSKYVKSDVNVDTVSFKMGPKHLEYQFYEALVGQDILRSVKKAELEGYDAAVIGCFYDPFLSEAREISNIIVTAPSESSMSIAISLGHKFSIIVGRRKWIPQMEENVLKYGFKDRLASFKSIDMGVLDFQSNQKETEKRLLKAGKEAVEEDMAEVIILGCTAEFGFYQKMQDKLGVPVIDASLAPLLMASFLIDIKKITGLGHSKIGRYEAPPYEEIKEWGLEKQYGFRWKSIKEVTK